MRQLRVYGSHGYGSIAMGIRQVWVYDRAIAVSGGYSQGLVRLKVGSVLLRRQIENRLQRLGA